MKFTRETLKRMLRTFLQAVIGFIATTGISVLVTNDYKLTENIVYGVIGSAIAAGIAAVMNLEHSQPTTDYTDTNIDNDIENVEILNSSDHIPDITIPNDDHSAVG